MSEGITNSTISSYQVKEQTFLLALKKLPPEIAEKWKKDYENLPKVTDDFFITFDNFIRASNQVLSGAVEEVVPNDSLSNQYLINKSDEMSYTANVFDSEPQKLEKSDIKDFVFDQYMKQQLIEDFFDSLKDELDDSDIDEMMKELATFSDEEVYAALSLPFELRLRKFKEFSKRINNGESPTDIINEHVKISSQYGFGIGYHTSPAEILPTQSGEWIVKGTENDHRDNDVNMAYYSTKYRHIYREGSPKYVYIIRTEPKTHKTDGVWSRAGSLSIIAKVPFKELVSYVEDTTKKILSDNREKNKTATKEDW